MVKGKNHRSELTERDWENAVQGLGNPLSVRFYSDKEDTEGLRGRELYLLRSQTLLATKSKEEERVIAIFAANLFLRTFKITG